ncbi:unnamed protein product [Penicillium olsonii]|uniref:F-box domain-containing protein n=1 Tax=Penicillium olsonii TaxID=99116 RepID=A0A9W4MTU8_PENOL|nr:unnamed protein product [Penicillium olsonii]CAG8203894.1 unnamed protein product [Penicillium olsonii]
MTSTTLIFLPPELWQEIASYLTNLDFKSMRLAAKQFSSAVDLRFQRVFLSANPLNIEVFRAVADHERFRHQVKEIIWDDARLPRGSRKSRYLPGFGGPLVTDEDASDNETGLPSFQRPYGRWWPLEYICGEYEDTDENYEDEDDRDHYTQLRKCSNFGKGVCPRWFKVGCAASVEDAYWRQKFDDGMAGLDREHPDYKSVKKLGSIGHPLTTCWQFYQYLIRQQEYVLAFRCDEEAFIHGLKQFPALTKVTVTSAAHGFLFNPLYQTPMIRSLPEGLYYPMPRGWPIPHSNQAFEVWSLPWKRLDERQKEQFHGFRIVTRALAEQKNNLVEFSAESRLLRTGLNCTMLDDTCEEYHHLATLLKKPRFRRLDLCFTLAGTWYSFPHKKLHDILRGARDLQELGFATTGYDMDDERKDLNVTPVPLKAMFPIESWPKLQHFELSRFIVRESDLISFLSELPVTVRSVKLSFLTFVDNGNHWHPFLEKLRKAIRENRLWSDRRRNVTVGCMQDRSLPGRARWIGKEVDEFLYGDGENPFCDPPIEHPKGGYGSFKDLLDPSRVFPR